MSKYSKFWPKGGMSGILHHYTETLVTFEYTTTGASAPRKPHSILFIGGLGDGLASTSYTADLIRALQPTEWSLFTLNLTSAGQAWGVGHLDRDTDEIATCLRYIQEYKTAKFGGGEDDASSSSSTNKIVLMGHSTGSQCVLHYLYRPNPHAGPIPSFDPWLEHVQRPAIDGAIAQAPVSDREAILWVLKHGIGDRTPETCQKAYDEMVAIARAAEKNGELDGTLLPLALTDRIYPPNTPISCRRFLSLVSPDSPAAPGEDDLFSSDLSDELLAKTFGMVHQGGLLKGKLAMLHSGADQAVPDWVDKEKLLGRWGAAADHNGKYQVWDKEHSGIIPNASHALSNDDQAEPRQWLCARVLSFLKTV
ncbi:hypothetical protein M406DRAFT_88301 [Cryphonectria parasitica EP155]|uniref:Uncharacterized protein n=1 Tax=Cryphonectria parasitica (strain ATCC 38755 / EP155) TaxID=660469 RepID=A0A9P5CNG8_CRYP1|nr:uncharacterized protein M406DRAFT_88301 [Cryphonectria parasitica EP155]KAF3765439.1 hypothetical protein M406DRAFT_88301 [Cryphonectria parasitica EP155]